MSDLSIQSSNALTYLYNKSNVVYGDSSTYTCLGKNKAKDNVVKVNSITVDVIVGKQRLDMRVILEQSDTVDSAF